MGIYLLFLYMATVFINLPVADLPKATEFYQAIGFTQNFQFSDEHAASMQYDETLYVMLLTHEFTKKFLPKHKIIADTHTTCAVLNAVQLPSKEAVDILFEKAIAAWGKQTIQTQDHGFMYGRDFEDLDGHIWELFWMDVSQMPQA